MSEARPLSTGYGAIVTICAAISVYLLALANGFAFDDVVLIPNDIRVTGGHFGQLLTTPYWRDSALALYRPLTSFTFGLDWHLSSGAPAWFHFTNVLWHALACLMAYALLTRFFTTTAALCGALVFALHPVHVEAVANVVGRGELIAATFFFAACLTWTARTLQPRARVALTALCYALAMFAKEGAVVLPAVLLLIDRVQGLGSWVELRRRWSGYAAILATFAVFMFIRWSVIGGVAPTRFDPSIEVATTVGQRLLTALQAWPVEAKLLLFPRTLLADYGPQVLGPIAGWTLLAVGGVVIIAALLIGAVVALARGQNVMALTLLWFPITILPVSNLLIPIGVLVAERTLYLPSFALALAVALTAQAGRRERAQLALLLVVVLVAFSARTITRVPEWQSTDRILEALVRDRPRAFRGQWHMARIARARNDPATALARYDRAIKLWPYREGLVQEAATYASSQGNPAWSHQLTLWGIKRWPNNVDFHRMHAAYAIDVGDTASARAAVNIGLRLKPDDKVLNEMRQAFGQTRVP